MVTAKTKALPAFMWLEQALIDLGPGDVVYATGVPWSVYVRLADFRDERRHRVKITFDRGRIEIMSPKGRHERPHFRLGLVVLALAEQRGIELKNTGATTLRNEAAEQGLEADESFYISPSDAVMKADDIDLAKQPPPDLAIEVDLTSSSVSKEAIYSRMGVPEIWRHDVDEIVIRRLQPDGVYQTADCSLAFPQIRALDLTRLLSETNDMGEVAFWRHCCDWAKTLTPPAANP
jgi:Uma2 family endonuclease